VRMRYKDKGIGRRGFLKCAAAGAMWSGLTPLGGSASAASRMDAGAPSETALGAAKQRAAHQILEYPFILHDPYALRMLGRGGETALRAVLPQYQLPAARSMRAAIVLRSRYADDRFSDAVRRGARQYVVLGAGLDTFAYRNQYPDNLLKIFEVDHPATQTWKRARLGEMDIAVPPSLAFAPVDFERESLADGLARAGFRCDRPAFFSWLGVAVYLSEAAVMDTLRYVASLAPKSEVVFDFSVPASSLDERRQRSREASAAHAAKLGEPWITFFEPPALTARLQATGFAETALLSPRDANRRYFDGRTDGFRVGGVHVMAARV
jgi:methyltransferase (TIGR00027 family)